MKDKIKNYALRTSPGMLLQLSDHYTAGCIHTSHGTVKVSCRYDNDYPYTRFDFAYQGRVYVYYEKKCYSERHLRTLAKRFAVEVAR